MTNILIKRAEILKWVTAYEGYPIHTLIAGKMRWPVMLMEDDYVINTLNNLYIINRLVVEEYFNITPSKRLLAILGL